MTRSSSMAATGEGDIPAPRKDDEKEVKSKSELQIELELHKINKEDTIMDQVLVKQRIDTLRHQNSSKNINSNSPVRSKSPIKHIEGVSKSIDAGEEGNQEGSPTLKSKLALKS